MNAVTTEVSINLEEFQVRTMSGLIQTVSVFMDVDKFSIYRPDVSVKENPKAWWR